MKTNFLSKARFLAIALVCVSLSCFAQEYTSGLHQWKVKDGTLTLISGIVTNGMALYVHDYSFYFQSNGEKDWYRIPLIDKKKPGNYELNLTAKAKDDRMVRDALLNIRNNDVHLLIAKSTREDDFEDSPIVVTKYRLIKTDGEDWPYFFQLVSSKTYPVRKNAGVDSVLMQEASQTK